MSAVGPTILGGAQNNNANSVAFNVSQAVPVGALAFVVVTTSAPQTAVFSATDARGNTYMLQSQNQPQDYSGNFAPMSVVFYWSKVTHALLAGDAITVNADNRYQILSGGMFYTGAYGSFTAMDLEYNQGTNLSFTVPAYAGQNLLAMLCVNGPQSDGWVQAPGWGADLGGGAGNAGLSVHGGAMVAPADGQYTYAPTLGRARWSVGFVLAFS